MESSFITGSDMATIAAAPAGQDVRKRWLLLVIALVIGLGAAFAIGSAVKKTSAPAVTGSLAQSSAASGQHASITALTGAGAVPALHAPPKKPKAKPKAKPKPTSNNTAPASSSSSSSSVASSSVSSSAPVQSSTPVQSSSSTPSHAATGGGSTSSGTVGVSHGGGGGGLGGG